MSPQDERRQWLIKALLAERGERLEIPVDTQTQNQLLRALLNVRPPMPASGAGTGRLFAGGNLPQRDHEL